MQKASVLLTRGLLLHCPMCGKGKLFRHLFKMYERCPVCGFTFEREEGYFSSAMAINLVVSELIIAIIVVPLAANPNIPLVSLLLWGLPIPFLLPLLLYRHSRSLWLSMDHYLHPIEYQPRDR